MLYQIWTILDKRQRRGFVGLVLLSFANVLAEIFGLSAVFVLSISIWMPPSSHGLPKLIAPLVKNDFFSSSTSKFILAAAVIAAYLIKMALALMTARLRSVYVQRQHVAFSERLLARYLDKDWIYFLDRNTAVLTRHVVNECDHIATIILNEIIVLLAELSVTLSLLAALAFFNPIAALAMGVFLLVATTLLQGFLRPWTRKLGTQTQAARVRSSRTTDMALRGVKEVALYDKAAFFASRLRRDLQDVAKAEATALTLREVPRHLIEFMAVVAFMAVLALEFWLGTSVQTISVMIWVIAAASYRLITSTSRISSSSVQISHLGPMFKALQSELAIKGPAPATPPLGKPMDHRSSLELRNVSFRYPGAAVQSLKSISAVVAFGQTVGIVGPSGAGKSTLIELLLGILDPQSGEILVDGRPLTRDAHRAWQMKVGYVPQKIFLANDTIARNIAFGVGDESISMANLREAADAAGIRDFIETELPKGYETLIGDGGATLSGGQQQRIVIARALYRRPEMLVLDEATSALDNVTENIVSEAIANLGRRMTVFIVAHRLSTVRRCDLILLLNEGALIQSGTFSELAKAGGIFKTQWAMEGNGDAIE